MKIAFLGMGLMGAPMALNCLRAGHDVTVWNRTRNKCDALEEAGAAVAATPVEAARGRDAVLLCVDDNAAVEAVLFGAAEGIERGALVIDHSTIAPAAEARFAERLLRECGATLLDAPVTGGDSGARAGTLSIMVGGPVEAFARAEPLLRAMGKTVTHIGAQTGDGQRAKLLNQMVVAINLMATTESMRLGERLGLNMQGVLAAIGGGAAGSWSLNNLAPKWLARNFTPGFRLRHLLKDVRYALEMLRESGGAAGQFPTLALACELLERAVAAGLGDAGTQTLGAIFEQAKPE
jgi:3-hydroxyisobutyrate dehydrogenase